ncbi:hypothetical protein IRZ71_17800 [Flavobacterium sp. ANB]|uniref:hypothetical protein n=1 Tax=unclassified Flavobacterium TaxID=196869 RepID=UPI0012B872CC|nr:MULTISPECIES: hypothetical protein [unclassified Flavobacterium]MBF4518215.1 hypothetical protein [Flavobacterium sp. ANB]MTD71087.1 hypothetical protein [Flavobacterium sp. LC2016-13]
MGTIFYLAMGWCGTLYPGWWRRIFKIPPPPPDPEPWWYIGIIGLGLATGLAAGTLFHGRIINDQLFSGQAAIASGLFAFAFASIVTGIASSFKR